MIVFRFVLEKCPPQKVEDDVTQISEIKKPKTDISKSYFDVTFQTETTTVHGVCFSPDTHKRLQKSTEILAKNQRATSLGTKSNFD